MKEQQNRFAEELRRRDEQNEELRRRLEMLEHRFN
jgi:hypothetical protein